MTRKDRARIGREPEVSPNVNNRQVAQVLAGTGSHDALSEQDQALVREEWADRMAARREALDYAAQFSAVGDSYSELDKNGNLVVHPAG